ncbi:ran-binding protein 3-like isoform X1 [Pelobates fuscus]|uniref:ran-binding protein 3-like isoform X1 n=1 Tax=Pelobates fuscus TaxID=191477 RepID=UPI002FE4EBDD
MRNKQAPLIKVNVLYPEIERLCGGSGASSRYLAIRSGEAERVNMCITATSRRDGRGNNSNVPAKNSSSHREQHLGDCKQESNRGKLTLPLPLFLLEKKERPFKRHASDLVLKSESGLNIYPEKRARSSSFTFHPSCSSSQTDGAKEKRTRSSSFTLLSAFPPSPPGLKNNVFMPSSLLQEHPTINTSNHGCSQAWNVIKPATLQPPQVPQCIDGKRMVSAADCLKCHLKDKKATDENFITSMDFGSTSKHGSGPTCVLDLRTKSQPFDQSSRLDKSSSEFVFGENMDKRVTRPQKPAQSQTPAYQYKCEGTSSCLQTLRSVPYQKPCANTSLAESAAVYSSMPRQKYELDQVEIITGEESERNVLQVNCKLFVLNSTNQMWNERGRGYLRLNDMASHDSGMFRSRIVMRNYGSLKLIFNSKIFDQMKLERANRRSLRITATDLTDNNLRVFLIQASVKDAGRLYAAIHHRLVALRTSKDQEQKVSFLHTEDDLDSLPLNSESESSEDEEEDEMTRFHITDHHQWIRRQPVLYS